MSEATALGTELDALKWVHSEVRERRPLPLVEVEAIAIALFAELRRATLDSLPRARVDDAADALAAHQVNVCVLSMALADQVQLDHDAVRGIGFAALLHDLGMVLLPSQMIDKPGTLTANERDQLKRHPAEGARIILEADAVLELPAVVAYEHHLRMDGSGYPEQRQRQPTHYITQLVQICDIYHALRSPRPFRPAWPTEIVSSYLSERAGFEFNPSLVTAFIALMRRYQTRGDWAD